MRAKFTAILRFEENEVVALSPELDIASQGATPTEALANLKEAVELFLETASAEEVHNMALKLSQRSRLKLAGKLLRSLDPDGTPDEALAEAARREAELESGKVALLNESEFWSGIAHRQKRA